jgi:hypothetical protein
MTFSATAFMRLTPIFASSIACAAVVLAVSGCTSGTPSATPTVTATVTATATASPAPAVTVTVAASAPAALTTMEAAAKHLYAAWQAGDKATAATGASPAAVDTLFAHAWKSGTYFFGGCDDTTGCQYNFAAGTVNMKISGDATSGYTVTAVTFGSAG